MSITLIGEIYRSCLFVRYVDHAYWWDMSIMFIREMSIMLLVRYVDHAYSWDMSILFISEICRGGQSNFPSDSPSLARQTAPLSTKQEAEQTPEPVKTFHRTEKSLTLAETRTRYRPATSVIITPIMLLFTIVEQPLVDHIPLIKASRPHSDTPHTFTLRHTTHVHTQTHHTCSHSDTPHTFTLRHTTHVHTQTHHTR
jgi:hypothetical protein